LAALGLAFLVSTPSYGAEKNKGEGAKAGPTQQNHELHGVIKSVNAEKRELVMEVRRRQGPGRPGEGGEKRPGALAEKQDQNAEESAAKEGEHHEAHLHVAKNAKITLDGKDATLEELKEGMHARVVAHEGRRPGGPAGEPGARPGAGSLSENPQAGSEESKEKAAGRGEHRHLVATEVHAFTHRPEGAPAGENK
jgi:hypothetical protein